MQVAISIERHCNNCFRALSSECTIAQSNGFTNAQHWLNMAGVSKRWHESVNKLLPGAQLVTNTLDNMKTAFPALIG